MCVDLYTFSNRPVATDKPKVLVQKTLPVYRLVSFLLTSNNEEDAGRYFRNILYPSLIEQPTFHKISLVDDGVIFFFEDLQSASEFSKNIEKFQDNFSQLGARFKKQGDIDGLRCLNASTKQRDCLLIYLDYAKKFGYINRIVSPMNVMSVFLGNPAQDLISANVVPQIIAPKDVVKMNSIDRVRIFLWRYAVFALTLTIFSYFALGGKEIQKNIDNI